MKIDSSPQISICLCTYKRPEELFFCLESLLHQDIPHPYEIIVTDNDSSCSGRATFEKMEQRFSTAGISTFYLVEPVQNIALARNKCFSSARGKLVAFLDDDETATPNWLNNLHQAMVETDADGVWGPVVPVIPESFPAWMRYSKLFDRPNPKDRSIAAGNNLRTGNAIIKRSLLEMREGPFDEAYGRTGGSDSELFSWLQSQGFKFIWAVDAEVSESLEEKRRFLKWHLIRGYRGGWRYSAKLVGEKGRFKGFLVSVVRIAPAIFRSFFYLLTSFSNPRAAAYMMAKELSGHVGKIGFFLHVKIEEYK